MLYLDGSTLVLISVIPIDTARSGKTNTPDSISKGKMFVLEINSASSCIIATKNLNLTNNILKTLAFIKLGLVGYIFSCIDPE